MTVLGCTEHSEQVVHSLIQQLLIECLLWSTRHSSWCHQGIQSSRKETWFMLSQTLRSVRKGGKK